MSQMACPNCNAQLTCGCQYRVAQDGTRTCHLCVNIYNAKLNAPVQPAQNLDYNNVIPGSKNQVPEIQSITHKFNNFNG